MYPSICWQAADPGAMGDLLWYHQLCLSLEFISSWEFSCIWCGATCVVGLQIESKCHCFPLYDNCRRCWRVEASGTCTCVAPIGQLKTFPSSWQRDLRTFSWWMTRPTPGWMPSMRLTGLSRRYPASWRLAYMHASFCWYSVMVLLPCWEQGVFSLVTSHAILIPTPCKVVKWGRLKVLHEWGCGLVSRLAVSCKLHLRELASRSQLNGLAEILKVGVYTYTWKSVIKHLS